MTLNELGDTLDKLAPGKRAGVHHDLFAMLFPPGEPDDRARGTCLSFAQEQGCNIDNKPGQSSGEGELWFVKNAPRP